MCRKMCSLARKVAELCDQMSSINEDDGRRIPALASAGQKANIFIGKEEEHLVAELLQLVVEVGKKLGCVSLPKVERNPLARVSFLQRNDFAPLDLRCDEEIRLEELSSP